MTRAQGSIEYLMMISAVLAIAVVVVILAGVFFEGYKDPAKISQDKSECSVSRIELVGYYERFDALGAARNNIKVRYNGDLKSCTSNTMLSEVESSCEIAKKTLRSDCFIIYVNDSPNGCFISEDTDCFVN